jgi:hypothetical protein
MLRYGPYSDPVPFPSPLEAWSRVRSERFSAGMLIGRVPARTVSVYVPLSVEVCVLASCRKAIQKVTSPSGRDPSLLDATELLLLGGMFSFAITTGAYFTFESLIYISASCLRASL